MELVQVLLFCLFAGAVKADFCQDNLTISELPQGILTEAVSLFTTGTISDLIGCRDFPIRKSNVKFWLFSRNNPTNPILLNQTNLTQLNPPKPIKFLSPGWLCNITNDRMPEMTAAYLRRYDAYVIIIDWSAYSTDLYSNSFCRLAGIAEIAGEFLCYVDANCGIPLTQVHAVGHSLGGHLMGLTGKNVQGQCNRTLGRITGLDPAGPLFQNLPASRRLDRSDAILVDVIHTNMLFLGFYGSLGTVDFYPNCFAQNGCSGATVNNTNLDIAQSILSNLNCNHLRSLDYMVESINSNRFTARSCNWCPGVLNNTLNLLCIPDQTGGSIAQMGEDCCPPNLPDDRYYLKTNDRPPYARG